MSERQVSADGQTYPLPRPFMVIATQNPLEFEGTYPLPESQPTGSAANFGRLSRSGP